MITLKIYTIQIQVCFEIEKVSVNFIDSKLQKTRIQIMSEKYSITIPKDTPEENIIHYSKRMPPI